MPARITSVGDSVTETAGRTQASQQEKAQNTFSTAMVISGIRCAFTYVIFPVFAPILGVASGVGSGIGLVAALRLGRARGALDAGAPRQFRRARVVAAAAAEVHAALLDGAAVEHGSWVLVP